MHERYAKEGLVCVSVTVDELDAKDRALKFLTSQKATFPNYLIDEPAETWQVKLDVAAPPGVLVFGRDSKRVARFPQEKDFTYDDVLKVVLPLLKNTP